MVMEPAIGVLVGVVILCVVMVGLVYLCGPQLLFLEQRIKQNLKKHKIYEIPVIAVKYRQKFLVLFDIMTPDVCSNREVDINVRRTECQKI